MLALTSGAGCIVGPTESSSPAGSASPASVPASERPEFGYEGDIGPDAWGRLSPEFSPCESGQRQSPIDLADATPESIADPEFAYTARTAAVSDSGHTITVAVPEGSTMTLDGTPYTLIQFHYHSPAEHPVDGRVAPIEWHFVHRAADGTVAVVGVPVEVGSASPEWDALVQAVREAPAPGGSLTLDVDVASLMPAALGSYRYDGSLTTPPCTEGVRWMVLSQPLTMSAAQIDIQRDRYEGNARPVADRNDRPVSEDAPDP